MRPPDILPKVGPLLADYDVLLCDIWGVVHDGVRAFPEANHALTQFRAGGGSVVLVSNAPMPAAVVADVLDQKGVARSAWDRIICSGDLALAEIGRRKFRRIFAVGSLDRDEAFFAALPGRVENLADADAVACTGLRDDRRETAADYVEFLAAAKGLSLPFVCANPDLVVHVGEALLPCAGILAAEYEKLGGEVFWAGKPHPVAYATALSAAAALRGGTVRRERVLAIGDATRTDLAAAAGAGVDALFIAGGIHRHEALKEGRIDAALIRALLERDNVAARAVAAGLCW